jgi:hypothetical protein
VTAIGYRLQNQIRRNALAALLLTASSESGGGIYHVAECLANYLRTKDADRDLLIRYAD